MIEELRAVHPDREIKVEMAIEKPLFCDSARVAQLLSNLVGNALTHGASGTPVDVSIRSVDGDLTIEVTNAGEVIPRHRLAGLFHPFARGAQSSAGRSRARPLHRLGNRQGAWRHAQGQFDRRGDHFYGSLALRKRRAIRRSGLTGAIGRRALTESTVRLKESQNVRRAAHPTMLSAHSFSRPSRTSSTDA